MNHPVHTKTLARLLALTALAAAAGAAHAQTAPTTVTRGAVSVTTTMGQLATFSPISNVINQTAVQPYTSGVTSFDAYVLNGPKASSGSDHWYSAFNTKTGFVTFDLGASYAINGMAFFNANSSSGYQTFAVKVFADTDNNPNNGYSNDLLYASDTRLATPNSLTVADFYASANTRYLQMQVFAGQNSQVTGFNEVVFRENLAVAAVPEPGTYALMLAGLGAVGFMARRRAA